jgi:hypothetical protein
MRNLVSALLRLTISGCCTVGLTSLAIADGLKVELSSSQGSIRVIVINTSSHNIRVNTRLAEGPNFDLWDLYFDVRDLRGQKKEYSMKATIDPPQESDWRDLWPHHFIGTQISLDWLGEEYDLDKGPYDITADYHLTSNDGRILQEYRSNTVRVMFGDREGRLSRLQESGEVYEVHLNAPKGNAPASSGQPPKTQ